MALAGWIVVSATMGSSSGGHGHAGTYESGGVLLTVNQAKRMPHDMSAGPAPQNAGNFSMPQSMMPGMQAADEDRLHVEVGLRNPTGKVKPYRPEDFRVISRSGGRWDLNKDSLIPGTLAPGYSVSLDLYFDIPLTQRDLAIQWSMGGRPLEIPLALGEAPAGSHGPGEAPAHTDQPTPNGP